MAGNYELRGPMWPYRSLQTVSLALPLWLCGTAVAASPLTGDQKREDPRLSQRVNIQFTQGYVTELMDRLARDTGVQVSAGGAASIADGAGDERITVYIRTAPLFDVLNAVWSLYSYRGAEWHWERDSKGRTVGYTLRRGRNAQLFPYRLRQASHEAYAAHTEAMLAAVHLPPDQLAALRRRNHAVDRCFESERLVSGLRAFVGALSPADQGAVLRGEARITVPRGGLSPSAQQWANSIFEQQLPPSIRPPGRLPPTNVTCYARTAPGFIFPSLILNLDGLGGYAYLGGADAATGFLRLDE